MLAKKIIHTYSKTSTKGLQFHTFTHFGSLKRVLSILGSSTYRMHVPLNYAFCISIIATACSYATNSRLIRVLSSYCTHAPVCFIIINNVCLHAGMLNQYDRLLLSNKRSAVCSIKQSYTNLQYAGRRDIIQIILWSATSVYNEYKSRLIMYEWEKDIIIYINMQS